MSPLAATPVIPLYAGFWRRAAAWLVDNIVLFVPNMIVYWLLRGAWGTLAQLVLSALYTTLMHASTRQATVGKIMFGIKVTDHAGQRLTVARAAARYLATWLSILTLGLGFVMAAFTARREALHDMIAGTYVVNENASAADIAAGGDTMPVTAGVWLVVLVLIAIPFFGGLLAAIAIPAYQDYLIRAKMSGVFAAAEPLKRQVEAAYDAKRPWQAGPLPISTSYAKSATLTPEGDIVVELADSLVKGGRVRFDPWASDNRIQGWNCHGEHVPPKWLPPSCRG